VTPTATLGSPQTGWVASDYLYEASPPHAVTSVDDGVTLNEYQYDANGNMTQRVEFGVTWTQTFNAENRLAAISDGMDAWTFVYDGDGNRVKQVNPDGTISLFLGGGIYNVEDAAGTPAITKYYTIAGQRVAMDDGSGIMYLLTDHLGSIVAVTDDGGQLVPDSEQRYMPFGEPRLAASSPTDFGFTGQRALAATGLMDYNARWYDAALGRFISADSLVPGAGNPQAFNRYAYVMNNPVNTIDPSGHKGKICNGSFCEDEGGTGIVGGCVGGFGCDMGGDPGTTTGGVPPRDNEEEVSDSAEADVDESENVGESESYEDQLTDVVEELFWPFYAPYGVIPDYYWDSLNKNYSGFEGLVTAGILCRQTRNPVYCDNPFWYSINNDPAYVLQMQADIEDNFRNLGFHILLDEIRADSNYFGNYDAWWLYETMLQNPSATNFAKGEVISVILYELDGDISLFLELYGLDAFGPSE
jgi:RHS repeat-associated protein